MELAFRIAEWINEDDVFLRMVKMKKTQICLLI